MTKETNGCDPAQPQDISGYYGFSLLLPEPPLQVLPSLAEAMGLENAIVTQQLHYLLLNPKNGRLVNGERWIFNTYEQWRSEFFPFWSERTVRRVFGALEEMHVIESCQPEGAMSRRKYYRINHGMLHRLHTGKLLRPCGQIGQMKRPDPALPLTETTSKTTESKDVSDSRCRGFDDARKERLLQRCPEPIWTRIPTQDDCWDFIQEEGLDGIASYRPDFYESLNNSKWRKWNGRAWVPVRNWKAFLRGLNSTLNRE